MRQHECVGEWLETRPLGTHARLMCFNIVSAIAERGDPSCFSFSIYHYSN